MKRNRPKRIGIDARFYGTKAKGLGRYTQEIVDNIIKLDTVNEYRIFLRPENFLEFKCDGVRVKKILADVPWYSWREQLVMPRLLIKEKLSLVHFPHFNVPLIYGGEFVVTIHDLILTKFPTVRATTLSPALYWLKNLLYRLVIWSAAWRARKIIAVSEFTKRDIVKTLRVRPDKISVTYEGVANLAKNRDTLFDLSDDKTTLLRYNINRPFLLYVGNAYPHKNLERLFEVFSRLRHQFGDKLQLVLVGKEDYFYERLKQAAGERGLLTAAGESPVVWTGYVTDEELEILFKHALVYVFPSLYEGFGLPPLEAMAKGCPVASSNSSSLPEILGRAAVYFNPTDLADMVDKISSVIKDDRLRRDLRQRGYEQVKRFSWWECARATFEVYKNVFDL